MMYMMWGKSLIVQRKDTQNHSFSGWITLVSEIISLSKMLAFIAHKLKSVSERDWCHKLAYLISCSNDDTYDLKFLGNHNGSDGNQLKIKANMVGDNQWTCIASNEIKGQTFQVSKQVKFKVGKLHLIIITPIFTIEIIE